MCSHASLWRTEKYMTVSNMLYIVKKDHHEHPGPCNFNAINMSVMYCEFSILYSIWRLTSFIHAVWKMWPGYKDINIHPGGYAILYNGVNIYMGIHTYKVREYCSLLYSLWLTVYLINKDVFFFLFQFILLTCNFVHILLVIPLYLMLNAGLKWSIFKCIGTSVYINIFLLNKA